MIPQYHPPPFVKSQPPVGPGWCLIGLVLEEVKVADRKSGPAGNYQVSEKRAETLRGGC